LPAVHKLGIFDSTLVCGLARGQVGFSTDIGTARTCPAKHAPETRVTHHRPAHASTFGLTTSGALTSDVSRRISATPEGGQEARPSLHQARCNHSPPTLPTLRRGGIPRESGGRAVMEMGAVTTNAGGNHLGTGPCEGSRATSTKNQPGVAWRLGG